MAQKKNDFEGFWKELKRRRVVHVITVYAAASFVILQVVDMVSQPLHFPEWTQGFIIVLLIIGFAVAVLLAWIFDITPAGVKKTKPASTVKDTHQTSVPASNRWKVATYVSCIVIIALVAVNFVNKRNLNADISKLEKSIAVLPFLNESPVDSNKYFINGIMEEVLTNLQKIKVFRVLSRTSTDQYKDQDRPTIPEIAKKLNVNYLVEGSGEMHGNFFRLRVQLIKARGQETHLWAKSYEQEIREVNDIFNIQSKIAQAIATELKITITPEERELIGKSPTDNLEAYNLYLKGTYCFEMTTAEGLKKASEYYEQALRRDPNYALAYIGLTNITGAGAFWGDVPPKEALPRMYEYLNKALKIDSTLSEAYWQLGDINTFYHWNWKEAERYFKKALNINPNSSLIHCDYSILLTLDGRHEDAIKEAQRAQELDPYSPYIVAQAGTVYYYAHQYEKSTELLEMAQTINPDYFMTYWILGNVYKAKAMHKETVAAYEKAVSLSDGNPFLISLLIGSYYDTGQITLANKLFDSLKEKSETRYVPATAFYFIHRIRGEEDLAMEWLKRACTGHDTYLPFLRENSFLFPEGSRYDALLTEAGL